MARNLWLGPVAALVLFGVSGEPVALHAADLTCPTATTLDALVSCIRGQMPGSGSNGFVAPSAAQQADWRTVVRQMLEGSCNFAVPVSLLGAMQLRTFVDTGKQPGCILRLQ